MALAVRVFIDHLPERAWEADRRDDSFAEMYARCRSELVALCRRQLGSAGDAEAVAQDAFLKAWVSLDRYSSARPFWPWLATIARRLCVDHLRRRQLEQQYLHCEQEFHGGGLAEPEGAAETKEECQAALQALKSLRPREQRIIGLREIDGWSIEQLARFEGISVDATRTALRRARLALRNSYERVLTGAPAVFILGLLARAKGRMARIGTRVNPTTTSMIASRGGELLVVALVVATGQGAGTAAPEAAQAPGATRPAAVVPATAASSQVDKANPGSGSKMAAAAPVGSATASSDSDAEATQTGGPAGIVPFDRVATPDDARITAFTMSPKYEDDGTIFASGVATRECATHECPVLFVSHDKGKSWARLPADKYLGGRILLAPAYPTDSRLFASSATALLVSNDGGRSFTPLTATGGEAAMSPGFSGDDRRIVVGGSPGWIYDDQQGVARPGVLVAPSSTLSGIPEFAPDVADGSLMLVGGTTATTTSPSASAVFACGRTACTNRATLDNVFGEPRVRVSPTFTSSGEAWAWRGEAIFRSVDGGMTFPAVTLPIGGAVREVLFGSGSTRYVALAGSAGGAGGVLRSTDGGYSWSVLRGTPTEALTVLPDGRMLAAAESDGGMSCSVDGGVTWQPRCA